MTPKRTIVVVAAVAVGIVAAALSYSYLSGAQNRAYKNAKLVSAYVVVKTIPQALTGAAAVNGGYIQTKSMPAEFRPLTAITSPSSIEGKEAASTFQVGQVVVSSMFVSPAVVTEEGAFSNSIPPGDVAVTISVDDVHGVAGLVVPGDHVDILVNNDNTESSLLQNVPVVAIGQESTDQTGGSTTTETSSLNSGLFTFAVSPDNATRIALAQQQDLGIYLLLVPPDNPVVDIGQVAVGNLLSGSQAAG
ncbi:MAG TPA: Flp pilus assembly protein CpaB [Acidimicrobiales bacterium]|nr:Flp pilus assembly protein CpaB [Acidimicrobiales bacterium]